jgi:hypothetical protein
LFAISLDVAELLAVVALGKSILGSISLPLIPVWQRLGKRKITWDFAVLGKVTRNRGSFMIMDSSGGERRVAVICLTLTTSKPRLTSS